MRLLSIQILALLFVLYCSSILVRNPSVKMTTSNSYNWLMGKWECMYYNSQIIETWGANNNQYIGKAIVYNKGIASFTEDLKIYQQNNNWYYCPKINGKQIPFLIIQKKENEFVSLNANNEFPQIIAYQLKSKDSLVAYIAGFGEDGFKKEQFNYTKANH